ncbi:MAG: BrnT family toxin [Desulfohalobiaceae bacterium]|nr:BrnT family toxin [Desulfohalobiaceae bacterium]
MVLQLSRVAGEVSFRAFVAIFIHFLYNIPMNFEWDPQKSMSNEAKHGIDFEAAKALWDDEQRIEIKAPYPIENRHIIISKPNKKLWTAVFTYRENSIRIISVQSSLRRAQDRTFFWTFFTSATCRLQCAIISRPESVPSGSSASDRTAPGRPGAMAALTAQDERSPVLTRFESSRGIG